MQTIINSVSKLADALLEDIATLIGEEASYRDLNADSRSVVFIGQSHVFPELPSDKKQLQSKLLSDCKHFFAICSVLLQGQTVNASKILSQNRKNILHVIGQNECTWYKNTITALDSVKKGLRIILNEFQNVYTPKTDSFILVPDTNALIYNPILQSWAFEEIAKFEIVLVPTILSELDALKAKHPNSVVREKCKDIIRKIKEYRRRGILNDGINILAGRIRLRSFAVEPNFKASLPWLDPTSQDDRMLASFIEVMRNYIQSHVILVTGDINLQNKAEFAKLPFIEPPEFT